MSSQGTLFDRQEPRAPPPPPSIRPRYQVGVKRQKAKCRYSKPDKRGKYAYEKLNAEIDKLPKIYQGLFHYLTIELAVVTGEQFQKCLRMFMALDNDELDDFDESRGRL